MAFDWFATCFPVELGRSLPGAPGSGELPLGSRAVFLTGMEPSKTLKRKLLLGGGRFWGVHADLQGRTFGLLDKTPPPTPCLPLEFCWEKPTPYRSISFTTRKGYQLENITHPHLVTLEKQAHFQRDPNSHRIEPPNHPSPVVPN